MPGGRIDVQVWVKKVKTARKEKSRQLVFPGGPSIGSDGKR